MEWISFSNLYIFFTLGIRCGFSFLATAIKPTVSGVVTSIIHFYKGLTDANHELHIIAPHYVTAADLFVFSSQTDTQGLVLIEAMAAGLPIVAVDAPGPMDVLSNGGGLLVPAKEEDFSDVVLTLLEDHERRDEMGRQALQITQQYSISATTKLLLGVYEEVIEAGPKNRGTDRVC